MKSNENRSGNALLIELVIVLFFFILSFAILSQVYAGAYVTENKAESASLALHDARNVNALLQAGRRADDGPVREEGNALCLDRDGYTLKIETEYETVSCGILSRWIITAEKQGEVLFTLPGARYEVTGIE